MKSKEYAKVWREKNREKIKLERAAYYTQNKSEVLAQMRERRVKVKSEVLLAYSSDLSCTICKISVPEFLAIDHIDGGGRKHCRDLGNHGSHRFYLWLQKNKYPPGYRVLCHNCNLKHGEKKQPKKKFKHLSEYSTKTAALVKWLIANPEKHAKYNQNKRNYRQKQRQEVITKYGGKCKCCGLGDTDILSIDHINGGGRHHRKKIGDSSYQMYKWIITNNFPSEFQILCMNCNIAKNYGTCPHQKKN